MCYHAVISLPETAMRRSTPWTHTCTLWLVDKNRRVMLINKHGRHVVLVFVIRSTVWCFWQNLPRCMGMNYRDIIFVWFEGVSDWILLFKMLSQPPQLAKMDAFVQSVFVCTELRCCASCMSQPMHWRTVITYFFFSPILQKQSRARRRYQTQVCGRALSISPPTIMYLCAWQVAEILTSSAD